MVTPEGERRNTLLTIALPNGSLQKKTLELFRRAGINIPDPTRQHWVEVGHELVKTVVWMRPQHIPDIISDGIADAGITGDDCFHEWLYSDKNLLRSAGLFKQIELPYSKSTLQPDQIVLIAEMTESKTPDRNDEIFTEFPNWTSKCLLQGSKVIPSRGSVEAFVPRRYRFGITVVETGTSLKVNGLKVVKVLATSSPGLYYLLSLPKENALCGLAVLLEQTLGGF